MARVGPAQQKVARAGLAEPVVETAAAMVPDTADAETVAGTVAAMDVVTGKAELEAVYLAYDRSYDSGM